MEFVLIEIDSEEWEYLWNWVAEHPINKGVVDPSSALHKGESWQYMGSFKQGSKVIHELRHRNHPLTNSVQTLKLKASESFEPRQAKKTYKIK